MASRNCPRLVWTFFGCVAVVTLGAAGFSAAIGAQVDPFPIALLAFPLVGALVAARHPSNGIGWVMLGVGAVSALDDVLIVYAHYAVDFGPGSLPRPDLVQSGNCVPRSLQSTRRRA